MAPEDVQFLLPLHVPQDYGLVPRGGQDPPLPLHPRHVKYSIVVGLPICVIKSKSVWGYISMKHIQQL